jgi:hypothetical protein
MGVLDTLSRLLAGEEVTTPRDAAAVLVQSYIDCVRRTAQLERHAEMAPQHCSAQALERLAAAEAEQCERLRQAIEVASAPLPPTTAEPLPRGALNHWARLVQDLDAHRRSVLQSRELALRFAAHLPQTAALFDSLCRADAMHCEDLRALIARADPQALN